nr:hypothetical protein [Tanacetum cinerariifolium]
IAGTIAIAIDHRKPPLLDAKPRLPSPSKHYHHFNHWTLPQQVCDIRRDYGSKRSTKTSVKGLLHPSHGKCIFPGR